MVVEWFGLVTRPSASATSAGMTREGDDGSSNILSISTPAAVSECVSVRECVSYKVKRSYIDWHLEQTHIHVH